MCSGPQGSIPMTTAAIYPGPWPEWSLALPSAYHGTTALCPSDIILHGAATRQLSPHAGCDNYCNGKTNNQIQQLSSLLSSCLHGSSSVSKSRASFIYPLYASGISP